MAVTVHWSDDLKAWFDINPPNGVKQDKRYSYRKAKFF